MSLSWLPREGGLKDHELWGEEWFGTEPPCILYELRPVVDPKGNEVEGLYNAWIILNNPKQYNSYTTDMVKGVIAGFHKASMDRRVVAAVFTAAGDKAFCTGGNTKEYAEYYSSRNAEYGAYMDLFNGMVDAILNCKKPTICRVNGMRVAGGQEIGMACDLAVAADTAIFGQAGPRHGSAPDGGSTDFLPWFLTIEDAMWNCISCEMWSAYKMKRLGLISKVARVIKDGDKFLPNPSVIIDKYVDDGEIVYGDFKRDEEAKAAREFLKSANIDFTLLDKEVNKICWTFTNLFPGCLIKSVDGIRMKKKFFWDQTKLANRHWLAANMQGEAYLGFHAFNTKKITGQGTIDFIKYRQLLAEGHPVDEELFEAVLGKPQE
ncbi:6-oxocyclohex-1-ene-1-carbonyl-CoA hydratase [candidate division LCP-89 bacterium B3_LCP]|uniref:6-oxocyclohex-1-ene-1-carbonyl-CoA hydratase n=1 Tax=candidate division LCP-89 bacterium B3_LCP TaxID=2012998 RepID=A0A532UYM4_UNCL8|nr:MAG: 6-oxocyclohex-1-ene-1-carbonyl-CoA hydratase [candidate division LCP-89 bacterium B3_LCP]